MDAQEEQMNAEEYMKQYQKCCRRIARYEDEIQSINDLVSHITPEMSSDRVQSSHPPDKLGELVARKSDLMDEAEAEIRNAFNLMEEIEGVIEQVSPAEYQLVLQKRYIGCKTWETIGHEMHYAPQWAWELNRRALKVVETII